MEGNLQKNLNSYFYSSRQILTAADSIYKYVDNFDNIAFHFLQTFLF